MPHPLFSSLQFVYNIAKSPRRHLARANISQPFSRTRRPLKVSRRIVGATKGAGSVFSAAPALHEFFASLPCLESVLNDTIGVQPTVALDHLPTGSAIIGTKHIRFPPVQSCTHTLLLSALLLLSIALSSRFRLSLSSTPHGVS